MIRLDRDGAVATITIDRPEKRNALTEEMAERLRLVSLELEQDDSVRAILVTGAGDRAFCAGGDLSTVIPTALNTGRDTLNTVPTSRFFTGLTKPVVVAAKGACFGAGFEILLGSDLRVVSEDAVFGLPETAIGLVPGGGSHLWLPRQLPPAVAKIMLLMGETLTAERALHFGLVNEVVAAPEVVPRARAMCERLVQLGPLAVRTAKEIVARTTDSAEAYALEHSLSTRLLRTADALEGVTAFQEKRTPRFRGI